MARWTQEQAIAYECARELVGHVIAILSQSIADAQAATIPDASAVAAMRQFRSDCVRERDALHVTDDAAVAGVRAVYGAMIRANQATHQIPSPAALAA